MKKTTQRQQVLEKLKADGEITNVWAAQNHILRLSERVRELKELGWDIGGDYIEGSKTFQYSLVSTPKRVEYQPVEINGIRMMRPVLV